MSIEFGDFNLIDYQPKYQQELIAFLDRSYKSIGYTNLELDTLDDDLLNIPEVYKLPSCFKLLLDGERIVGSVAVKVDIEAREAELKRVFVDEKYQGLGLGKKLSLWAFDYAKSQDCELMHIWSGTLCEFAHGLYERLGAKNMQTTRFTGGQDDCYEYYFLKDLN